MSPKFLLIHIYLISIEWRKIVLYKDRDFVQNFQASCHFKA